MNQIYDKKYTEDAKIVMDIHDIAESYWCDIDSLKIQSTDKDIIGFSFVYNMMSFATWEVRGIKNTLRRKGYELTGYGVVPIQGDESKKPKLHVNIWMRTSSKKRRIKEFLHWLYKSPIRFYWRYRYWRNYGTWRY